MIELAKLVADGIERDGAAAAYLNASDDIQVEFCQVYAAAETRTFDEFITKMRVNQEAREIFCKLILKVSDGRTIY